MRRVIALAIFLIPLTTAQPAPALPIPVKEVSKKLEKACTDGNVLISKVSKDPSIRNDLIDLVIQLEYDLIVQLETRTRKEIRELKQARMCIKNLAQRTWIYLKRSAHNSPRTE